MNSTNSKYTVEQLSPSRWFIRFRTDKGQNLTVELGRIETPEKLTKSDLMYMWVKNKRLPAPLPTWWDVKVYAYDSEGYCYHWFNPQVKEITEQHTETVYPAFNWQKPEKVTKTTRRCVINFNWVIEATEQNAKKILDEVEKMANADVKIIRNCKIAA